MDRSALGDSLAESLKVVQGGDHAFANLLAAPDGDLHQD
jgi:hypothetical protein